MRALILRAARVEQERVRAYLLRVRDWKRLRGHVLQQIIMFTPTLVAHHSAEIVSIAQFEIKGDLPADEEARERRGGIFSSGISHHDWHHLSIHDNVFYPASPLREPFPSLFRVKPQEALALVRDITNHAITAWRQLCTLDREQRRDTNPRICAGISLGFRRRF